MLTVRPATEKDYPAIVHWNETKGEDYLFQWAGFTTYTHPLTADQIARQAGKDGVHLYLALDGDTPIGAGEICDINKGAKTGRICRLIFAEEAKNKGFGEQFLQELSRIAFTEMGLVSLSLRVYCFNANAIRCYEKVGFRVSEFFSETDPHWNNYSMELKKV
ncbi:MAG: GNAT family N-acetyltransferase [Bacillota bacterium]|nr:GNAT family N-acetyltransferase [Bacillota bacterium]